LRRTDYAHDKGGNRTSVAYRALPTDANPAASDTYTRTAGTNRLASITTAAGTRTISYDARGNTASETRPAGVSVSTSYDGYGRLTGYTRTGDPTQTNVYNGLDDRVAVTSGGTTRRYVFDADGRVMGEYGTSASDVIAEFIWLNPEVGDGSAFGGDDGVGGYAPLAVASGPVATPTLLWVHGNHLGVPQVYTTSSGALASPGAWQLPGFPGQSRTLADLYYNRYRDYDPSTGRYIQADPIGLAGDTNPYVYAGGNPVTGIDPSGLYEVSGHSSEGQFSLIGTIGDVYGDINCNRPITVNDTPRSIAGAMILGVIDAGELRLGAAALGKLGGLTRQVIHGHHPIPKFLGGHRQQALSRIGKEVHDDFHRRLRQSLRENGLSLNVGGIGGGGKDWAKSFRDNPENIRKAMDAVLDASRATDMKHGTSITQDVWNNVMHGNF